MSPSVGAATVGTSIVLVGWGLRKMLRQFFRLKFEGEERKRMATDQATGQVAGQVTGQVSKRGHQNGHQTD